MYFLLALLLLSYRPTNADVISEGTLTPTDSLSFNYCRARLAMSDKNRDDFLTIDEYVVFCNQLASGQWTSGHWEYFDEIPQPLQNNYIDLIIASSGDVIEIYGVRPNQRDATSIQLEFVEQICSETIESLYKAFTFRGASHPIPGVDGHGAVQDDNHEGRSNDRSYLGDRSVSTDFNLHTKATDSPTQYTTQSMSFNFCRPRLAISDDNQDDFLSIDEYVIFCNRLASSEWTTGQWVHFEELPQPLQDNYIDLVIASTGETIEIYGVKPNQHDASSIQFDFVEQICSDTIEALYKAFTFQGTSEPISYGGGSFSVSASLSPNNSPTQSPIESYESTSFRDSAAGIASVVVLLMIISGVTVYYFYAYCLEKNVEEDDTVGSLQFQNSNLGDGEESGESFGIEVIGSLTRNNHEGQNYEAQTRDDDENDNDNESSSGLNDDIEEGGRGPINNTPGLIRSYKPEINENEANDTDDCDSSIDNSVDSEEAENEISTQSNGRPAAPRRPSDNDESIPREEIVDTGNWNHLVTGALQFFNRKTQA